MTRTLVTGIDHSEGHPLAEMLLEQGRDVFVLHPRPRLTAEFSSSQNLRVIHGDLLDRASVQRAIADIQPSEIFHLSHGTTNTLSSLNTLAGGPVDRVCAECLYDAVRRYSPNTHVIATYSPEIYGIAHHHFHAVFDECTEPAPVTTCGHAQYAAWQVADRYRRQGLMVSRAVISESTPQTISEKLALQRLCSAIARLAFHCDPGAGSLCLDDEFDPITAEDAADALVRIGGDLRGDDYTVGSGEAATFREALSIACDYVGLNEVMVARRLETTRMDDRSQPASGWIGDGQRVRKLFGWSPQVTLRELIIQQIEMFIREQRRQLRGMKVPALSKAA